MRALQNPYKRKREGIVHNGMGHRVEWEDVFVEVFGSQWRAKRDTCASILEWMKLFGEFESTICSRWGLPSFSAPSPDRPDTGFPLPPEKQRRTTLHPLESLPRSHGDGAPQIKWEAEHSRVCFVVDCLPLADVMNGRTKLLTPELEPAFNRMSSYLFGLIEAGWLPPSTALDYVIWRKRCFNKIADYIVNYTMDTKRSWHQKFIDGSQGWEADEVNLVVYSDGGTRANSCSAGAWYIEAHFEKRGKPTVMPVAMAGTFLETPVSSFTAEIIGLDEAVSFVSAFTSMFGNDMASGRKRRRT